MTKKNPFDCSFRQDEEPDFINEEGVKWWLQKVCWGGENNLKERLDKLGIRWYFIEMPDGDKCHVVLKGMKVIKEETSLGAVSCFLDLCPMMFEEEL